MVSAWRRWRREVSQNPVSLYPVTIRKQATPSSLFIFPVTAILAFEPADEPVEFAGGHGSYDGLVGVAIIVVSVAVAVLFLILRQKTMIVITCPEVAHEALIENGALFASRPPDTPNKCSINSALYGPVCRTLRRNMVSELLIEPQIQDFLPILRPLFARQWKHVRKWGFKAEGILGLEAKWVLGFGSEGHGLVYNVPIQGFSTIPSVLNGFGTACRQDATESSLTSELLQSERD